MGPGLGLGLGLGLGMQRARVSKGSDAKGQGQGQGQGGYLAGGAGGILQDCQAKNFQPFFSRRQTAR